MSNKPTFNQTVTEASESSQTAVKQFCDGCNCSQAVLMAFAGRYGMDEAMAMQISAGLGGGVGRMGEVCGTLTGAALVLGLKMGPKTNLDREAKEATYVATRQLQERFIEHHGSNRCKDLLNKDLSVASEYQQAKELGLFKTQCPNYVATVVSLLEQLQENSEQKNER